MENIFKKGDASIGENKDDIQNEKLPRKPEVSIREKGKRVLHDFHVVNITLLYEVSVKSIEQ